MLMSFKPQEIIDGPDITIDGKVYKFQENFENEGMRIWEAEEGIGLVAVRSPRTLLISLYNENHNKCTRKNLYEPDPDKTKKN